ncbi:MAG: hypothetical protein MHMPM18_003280 [Marteilia pararefringens]
MLQISCLGKEKENLNFENLNLRKRNGILEKDLNKLMQVNIEQNTKSETMRIQLEDSKQKLLEMERYITNIQNETEVKYKQEIRIYKKKLVEAIARIKSLEDILKNS